MIHPIILLIIINHEPVFDSKEQDEAQVNANSGVD